MIITCTACEKKFVVPDSAIPAGGRIVQCSSCSNKWNQLPIKIPIIPPKRQVPISSPKKIAPTRSVSKIKSQKPSKPKKSKGPAPYSEEYMKQKWGSTVQNYAEEKGLTSKKLRKKQPKNIENVSFGFFNYIITYSIFIIFFIGILNFERTRLVRKFPFLEPYIDSFFESLEIFKTFILDYYR